MKSRDAVREGQRIWLEALAISHLQRQARPRLVVSDRDPIVYGDLNNAGSSKVKVDAECSTSRARQQPLGVVNAPAERRMRGQA